MKINIKYVADYEKDARSYFQQCAVPGEALLQGQNGTVETIHVFANGGKIGYTFRNWEEAELYWLALYMERSHRQ